MCFGPLVSPTIRVFTEGTAVSEIVDALLSRHVWLVVRDQPADDGVVLGTTDAAIRPAPRSTYERIRKALPDVSETAFYSSPARRAQQTASRLYPDATFEKSDKLGPRLYGTWEGMTWEEIRKKDAVRAEVFWRESGTSRPPEGESLEEVVERWHAFATGLTNQTDWSNCVVVTHPEMVRAALCDVLNIRFSSASRIHIEPLSVVSLSWSCLGWRLDELHTRGA